MSRIGRQYAYSQNSIRSPLLVKRLLDKSRISCSDNVIEIGAGRGIITQELAKRCKSVVAYEIDPALYACLTNNLNNLNNIKLLNTDFLKSPLPDCEYKVFANIPFNFTSRIISKLLKSDNFPSAAYLILQEEAAEKYAGIPRETQISLLLKPIFKITVLDKLRRADFEPKPRVKSVLMEIEKLNKPLVTTLSYAEYCDFIVYATTQWKPTIKESLKKVFTKEQMKRLSQSIGFNQDTAPLDVSFEHWLGLYHYFCTSIDPDKKKIVKGSYLFQQNMQNGLKKVYRTR